ncbi:FAD:protein FMN transferase [Tepidanaerobacter sp. GT38]|uniref:FAD:protein FMN transferase n=1 Tax=Tepidanaerobacter sp. GT38 TaxID=2722793 RepID=UPI00351CD0B1|nr:FAD:protein FMN transferase [Tepidanaerobacter sp. GT38]
MRSSEEKPVTKTNFMLDTLISIQAFGPNATDAINKAFERIDDIEKKMTSKADFSEVISINEMAGRDFYKVSPDTFFVIKKGLYFSNLSEGKFDITVGPLVKLWGIGTEHARVPSKAEISKILPLVDYRQIELDEKNNSVFLKRPGMSIELGGIAKGYAADEAVKVLRQNGVKHGTVDLGGNIIVIGTKPDGKLWKIGIQNPFFKTRGSIVATVEVADKTLVTSGPYERYIEKDGKIYHHILDTRTGFPVENELMSVTIIAESSIDADALSTTVFAMGLEEGMDFVESIENIDAIFITKDYKVYTTSGVENLNFKIVDKQFELGKNI